ncbi:MAG TPA: PKD domain-containing protein, partial [Bacteroidia bacterium]|nr:PKD domain-containing protein [Bacteroidia bacterium]
QYVFETTVTCSQDDNPANNTNITELDVVDACAPTMQLSYVAGGSDGGIAWTGGIGDEGVGVYYAPPVFPYDIVSLQFFIDNNLSNNYTAAIYDDDGPGGTAGTLLYDSLILAPASSAWSTVTLQTPLTIASGGFYVAWLQGGPQIFIGYEFDQPHSYRNYEIITSIWSPYRSNGQQDFLIRATINNYPTVPTAGFTWANSGPLTATFTDNSTPPVATYLWDFGDMQTDATANPTHTYATAGTYTVCQTVASPCGNDMICETIYVCDEPVATFTESTMGDTVTFTDQATGNIESWEWDFGDGNTATSPSPVHGYSAPGTYTVCLTVTDTCGNTDSSCTTIMIISTTTADIQSLIAGVYPVPAGDVLNIQFTSEISGGRIILFDLSGKRLLEQSGVTGKLVELDVASLASGVYFIRIEDENNSCFIRFIKN